jgi:hypothetical protein
MKKDCLVGHGEAWRGYEERANINLLPTRFNDMRHKFGKSHRRGLARGYSNSSRVRGSRRGK